MKRTTAQRFVVASGILALLGGGTCFLSINPPVSGDKGLAWAILGGLFGIGALVVAVILGIIGLISWYQAKD